ncbi:MAG: hypothetical protein QW791_07840 [Candidatus Bathyarchaeia archaeon]
METPKTNLVLLFVIALVAIVTTALVAGLVPALHMIQSSGNVKALGIAVYGDEGCTQNLTSIDWGFVEVEKSYAEEIWVKNTGNAPVKLNMTTENWEPTSAKDYITLVWDLEGNTLEAGKIVKATLTLSVSANVVQTSIRDFSFTIVIIGNEF